MHVFATQGSAFRPAVRPRRASSPEAGSPLAPGTPAPSLREEALESARRRLFARGLAPQEPLLEKMWSELERARVGGPILAVLFQAVCAGAGSELELAQRCRAVARAVEGSDTPPMVELPTVPGEEPGRVFAPAVREAMERELLLPEPELESEFRRLFGAGRDMGAALDALALADIPAGSDREERLRSLERLLGALDQPQHAGVHFAAVAAYGRPGSDLLETTESYLRVRGKLVGMGKPELSAPQVFPYIQQVEPDLAVDPLLAIPAPPLGLDQKERLAQGIEQRFGSELLPAHYASVLGNRLEGESLDSAWYRYLYLADALHENGRPAELLPQLFRLISGWSTGPERARQLLLDFRAGLPLAATVGAAVEIVRPRSGIEVGEREVRVGRQRLPRRS